MRTWWLKLGMLLTLEKRLEILEWIYKDYFEQRHKEILKPRVPGSGEWFLGSEAYRNWLEGSNASMLFCHGMRTTSLSLRLNISRR